MARNFDRSQRKNTLLYMKLSTYRELMLIRDKTRKKRKTELVLIFHPYRKKNYKRKKTNQNSGSSLMYSPHFHYFSPKFKTYKNVSTDYKSPRPRAHNSTSKFFFESWNHANLWRNPQKIVKNRYFRKSFFPYFGNTFIRIKTKKIINTD